MMLKHKHGENPYLSAQQLVTAYFCVHFSHGRRFLTKHELDQMFLEEIAQFIIKNTTTPTFEVGSNQVGTRHKISITFHVHVSVLVTR